MNNTELLEVYGYIDERVDGTASVVVAGDGGEFLELRSTNYGSVSRHETARGVTMMGE